MPNRLFYSPWKSIAKCKNLVVESVSDMELTQKKALIPNDIESLQGE